MESLEDLLDGLVETKGMSWVVHQLGLSNILEVFADSDVINTIGAENTLNCIELDVVASYYSTGDIYDAIDGWEYTRDNYYDSMYDYMYDSIRDGVLDSNSVGKLYDLEDVVNYWSLESIISKCAEEDVEDTLLYALTEYSNSDEYLPAFLLDSKYGKDITTLALIKLSNQE